APPYSSGTLRPSRPSAASLGTSSCGKRSSSSQRREWGAISFLANSRTVWRNRVSASVSSKSIIGLPRPRPSSSHRRRRLEALLGPARHVELNGGQAIVDDHRVLDAGGQLDDVAGAERLRPSGDGGGAAADDDVEQLVGADVLVGRNARAR